MWTANWRVDRKLVRGGDDVEFEKAAVGELVAVPPRGCKMTRKGFSARGTDYAPFNTSHQIAASGFTWNQHQMAAN